MLPPRHRPGRDHPGRPTRQVRPRRPPPRRPRRPPPRRPRRPPPRRPRRPPPRRPRRPRPHPPRPVPPRERRRPGVPAVGDCNLNGVTPETEETPVTDVTTSQGREPTELSAADEQVLRE